MIPPHTLALHLLPDTAPVTTSPMDTVTLTPIHLHTLLITQTTTQPQITRNTRSLVMVTIPPLAVLVELHHPAPTQALQMDTCWGIHTPVTVLIPVDNRALHLYGSKCDYFVYEMVSLMLCCYSYSGNTSAVGSLAGHQYSKVSYDTPRFKLTPERAIPLVKWFEEHKDHPYPSRHEKMVLCQSTQLTFTQVKTTYSNTEHYKYCCYNRSQHGLLMLEEE